jgi:flagellar operon protein
MINNELQTILNSYQKGDVKGPSKEKAAAEKIKAEQSELEPTFDDILKKNQMSETNGAARSDNDLLISQHAIKRMTERNINLDAEEFTKLKSALQKLRTKGGQDSLVITNKAAYILDVKNNKVVTAMDKKSLNDNVFTKIDSTLIL